MSILTPEAEIQILRNNVAELQEQLQASYVRIDQLLMENNYRNSMERVEYITK